MNRNIFITCLIVSLVTTVCNEKLRAQYQLKGWVFGSGGGVASNESYTMMSTQGQPLIGVSQNDSFRVQSGFWAQIALSPATSVDQRDDSLPYQFRLDQNYPNPFNPVTQIRFSIPEENRVRLVVYDLLGRKVADLINEDIQPGEYTVSFEAGNLPSGIYIYRLQSGSYVNQNRMILLK
jgi:hypothetical protein